MRENRLSGSEGGATLIPSSLPLSFILVPPGQPPGQLHLVPAGQHSLPPNLPRIQDEFRMRIH